MEPADDTSPELGHVTEASHTGARTKEESYISSIIITWRSAHHFRLIVDRQAPHLGTGSPKAALPGAWRTRRYLGGWALSPSYLAEQGESFAEATEIQISPITEEAYVYELALRDATTGSVLTNLSAAAWLLATRRARPQLQRQAVSMNPGAKRRIIHTR